MTASCPAQGSTPCTPGSFHAAQELAWYAGQPPTQHWSEDHAHLAPSVHGSHDSHMSVLGHDSLVLMLSPNSHSCCGVQLRRT